MAIRTSEVVMTNKGGFKNIKLGKNVYRQMKRKGRLEYQTPKPPPRPPAKRSDSGR